MKVIWSTEAKLSYYQELDFIYKKWNKKEVEKFIKLIDEFVKNLEIGILQGKNLHNNNLRSFVISKQTTIFFDYHKDKELIELLLFWNNSQNPKELKNMLEGI